MIVDFPLSKAGGRADQQERDFAKQLLDAGRTAADEWATHIDTFLPNAEDVRGLPDGSWLLDLTFTLRKPFSSKSEIEFHESQNPIVRDHLTALPTVKPTTWKGHLAFAAARLDIEASVRERLFGKIRGDESGQAGRLHFFPTFFVKEIAREVITPLHRDTRTPARGPIYIEVIPAGQQARFCLLYVPRPKGEDWHSGQIADDLLAASRAIEAMLLHYGFSAKKTAGWGVAADSLVSGTLAAKGSQWPAAAPVAVMKKPFVEPDEPFTRFMDPSGKPLTQLKKPSGAWLSNKEFRASDVNVGSLGVYRKFRDWYESHGEEWMRKLAGQSAASATIALQKYTFQKVNELVVLAHELALSLKGSASA
jgi:hypothetical protein